MDLGHGSGVVASATSSASSSQTQILRGYNYSCWKEVARHAKTDTSIHLYPLGDNPRGNPSCNARDLRNTTYQLPLAVQDICRPPPHHPPHRRQETAVGPPLWFYGSRAEMAATANAPPSPEPPSPSPPSPPEAGGRRLLWQVQDTEAASGVVNIITVTGTAVASWPSPPRRHRYCRRLLAFNLLTVTCSPALPSLFAVNLLAVTGTAVTSSPSTSSPSHALPSLFAVASSPSTSSPSPALPSPRRHRHCRRLMAVTSSPSPVLPSPPRRQPPHRHLHCRHLAVTGTAVASCPSPPRRHQHCRRLLAVNLLAVASLPLPQPQRSKADWRPEARARGQQHRPPRPQIRLRTPLICEPQRQQEQEPSFAVLAGPSALEAPRDALRAEMAATANAPPSPEPPSPSPPSPPEAGGRRLLWQVQDTEAASGVVNIITVTGTAVASWPSPPRRHRYCRRLLAFNLLTVTCSPALPSLFAVNLLAVTGTAVTSSPSTSSPSHALPSLFAVASSPSTSSPSPALPSPRRHRHCRRLMAVTSSPSPVLPSPPRRQPPHRHLHCRHLAVTGTAVASSPSTSSPSPPCRCHSRSAARPTGDPKLAHAGSSTARPGLRSGSAPP
ncbi:hypothetical protein PLESTF_001964600 [Pleodorina starrii]|nr:hypothetical protein PLESTF_001964600 [Pleodorina starrii]